MSGYLIGILAYIIFQLILGIIVSRKIHSDDDFILAGRKLGYLLVTFSVFATWFGAESCIGTSGAAYSDGLVGVTADPFGYAIVLFILGLFFASRLWNMKLTTISDFFRNTYDSTVEKLTAIILIPTSLLWAAAQIRAFGQVLSASSELELTLSITISAIVVIVYTGLGGLLADAITDIVQGTILIIGLIVIFFSVLGDVGGLSQAIGMIDTTRLTFVPHSITDPWHRLFTMAESWAVPICGSLVAQEVISRMLAARSATVARRSSLLASVMYILIGMIPLFIGLVGFYVMPGLNDPEQILPRMAQFQFHKYLYIIFAGALVSAILSTVDSALLASSALLNHNLIFNFYPNLSDRTKLIADRTGVLLLGITSYILALHAEGIYSLVKEASAFGSAGVFVIYIIGMYSKKPSVPAAVVTLITGATTYFIGKFFIHFEYSFLLSVLIAVLSYYTVILLIRVISSAELPVAVKDTDS
ncbi:MAG: sodium:solute symporter family protein [Spirochaetota bacterium]